MSSTTLYILNEQYDQWLENKVRNAVIRINPERWEDIQLEKSYEATD
jgi:hypothetical protein